MFHFLLFVILATELYEIYSQHGLEPHECKNCLCLGARCNAAETWMFAQFSKVQRQQMNSQT